MWTTEVTKKIFDPNGQEEDDNHSQTVCYVAIVVIATFIAAKVINHVYRGLKGKIQKIEEERDEVKTKFQEISDIIMNKVPMLEEEIQKIEEERDNAESQLEELSEISKKALIGVLYQNQ